MWGAEEEEKSASSQQDYADEGTPDWLTHNWQENGHGFHVTQFPGLELGNVPMRISWY